jgi:uncharacterized protein YjbI with pentapeptide repeats
MGQRKLMLIPQVHYSGTTHMASRTKGPKLSRSRTTGKVGPHIRELEDQAAQAQKLILTATLDVKQRHVDIHIASNPWGTDSFSWIYERKMVDRQPGPSQTMGLRECLWFFAREFPRGQLRLDSINVRVQEGERTGRDLKRLAIAAWCEALGLEIPSDEEMRRLAKVSSKAPVAIPAEYRRWLRHRINELSALCMTACRMAVKRPAIAGWTPKCPGRTFVFAGHVKGLSEMEALVKWDGGQIVDEVSPRLDYLVIGRHDQLFTTYLPPPEPLLEQVKELDREQGANIRILEQKEFYALFRPTREEAIALLKAGPVGWAKWRLLRFQKPMLDLTNADLRGLELSEDISFFNVLLDGADFTGARLAGQYFPDLRRVTLDRANVFMSIKSMEDCSLREADLSGWGCEGSITGCNFDGAKMSRFECESGQVADSTFRNVDLTQAQFEQTKFTSVDFTDANLSYGKLRECEFKDTKLVRANLSHATLVDANLAGVDLTDATLRGAQLQGADLTGARIDGADFVGAAITATKLDMLAPNKAWGLDLSQAKVKGTVGPHMQELEKQAALCAQIDIRIELDLKGWTRVLKISRHGRFTNSRFESTFEGGSTRANVRCGPSNVPIHECMLYIAQQLAGGRLRLDTLSVRAVKAARSNKELTRLALGAWCEAFGVDVPSEQEWKALKTTAKRGQAALREELLAELRRGPQGLKKWNAGNWGDNQKAGSFHGVDLSGLNLKGLYIAQLDFSGACFDRANFASARIIAANLTRASFRKANLQDAEIHCRNGLEANFTEADLTGADLSSGYQNPCCWRRTNFQKAKLTGVNFTNADLCGADFTGAILRDVVFKRAKFDEATRFPKGFVVDRSLRWVGAGPDPRLSRPAPR